MRRFISLFVMLLVFLSCWIPVASAQNVVFTDSALEATVRAELSIMHDNPIPVIWMNGLQTLTIGASDLREPATPIKNLVGLEHARNLTTLTVWHHDVSDLTPVGNLPLLTTINVLGNNVRDLTPLQNLTSLETLDVSLNDIQSIPSLGNLTLLKTLRISANRNLGDNIEGLSTLTALTELQIASIGVRDLQPLQALTNLESLYAMNNLITDISPLGDLTNLEQLWLRGNEIRDISPLRGATALKEIWLEGNEIRDVSPLTEFTALINLIFMGNVPTTLHLTNPLSYPSLYTHIPIIVERNEVIIYRPDWIWGISFASRVPTTLEIVSGDGQAVGPGEALPEALVVKVLDENGERFAGVPVTFAVTEGEGTVDPAETTALDPTYNLRDAEEGEVQTTFTPGKPLGQRTVVATVTHEETTLQATFTINVVPGALAAPTIATGAPLLTSLPVRWIAPSYALQGYELRYRVKDSEAWTDAGHEGTETRLTLTDLIPGTTYELQVRAKTEAGFSPWSPSGFGTTRIAAPMVTTVTPPLLPTSLPVGWAAPSYAVRGYELRYRVEDSEAWTDAGHKGTETRLTLTDLIPGTTYELQVRAKTEAGFSPWSPSGFGTTGYVPVLVKEPAPVALDRLVFNEIRNASAARDDWVEVKNISDASLSLSGWELSIVAPSGDAANRDVVLVTFPAYTLPAGEVLLITNTAPGETALASGVNIATGAGKKGATHRYFVASGLKLPATRYLLLLRSAIDKNGTSEALEDVAGNYFRETGYFAAEGGTQVWPLQGTELPGDAPPLTEGEAWQRVSTEKRGYVAAAWRASGYHGGLGYRRAADAATSLGTPGYDVPAVTAATPTAQLSVSELMLTTGGARAGPQWIELYNPSLTAPVALEGWRLVVEYLDVENARRHRHEGISFSPFTVLPNQTLLLTTWHDEHSGHFPESRVYHLGFRHKRAFNLRERRNDMLNPLGFSVQLLDAAGVLVDRVGNLDGVARTKDAPVWQVPPFETADGVRVSLLRKYADGAPLPGTEAASWVSASQVKLVGITYFGRETDLGTPGYRRGGALPVVLSQFHALQTEAGVVIRWTTESEVDLAGFNILRGASRQGPFRIINPALILGAGTSGEEHIYTFTDTAAEPGVVSYYRLEEVSFGGVRLPLATTRLKGHVGARGKFTTRWGELKAR